ncbi:MAG: DUF1800 domain-containing protein [Acidobacteria bacterium]|nr:DUF1800 domain-containing protein [Acidobacteriota bacterium]
MARDKAYAPGWSDPNVPALDSRRRRHLPRRFRAKRVIMPRGLVHALRRDSGGSALPRAPGGGAGDPIAAPEHRLVHRATMGATAADLERLSELGYNGWLAEQLDYESLDDSALEESLGRALPTINMSAAEILSGYANNPATPIFELINARLYRAVYSPRQLYERMVTFWTDHFHIALFSAAGFALKPVDQREVIRRHALGNFRDLLHASAHSPAMLVYLTNDSNVAGHPNENYARELMELHTLGADRGYTQRDVVEVARCFTGWTLRGSGSDFGEFFFDASAHDDGEKRVLGSVIPAGGGIEDGERVLDILAGHVLTSKFIAEKLAHFLWGYEPPRTIVNRAATVLRNTDGDIKAVVKVLLKRSRVKRAKPKLKRPFHLVTSAARALGADIRAPFAVLEKLFQAGHLPFYWAPPNGYPDTEEYWSGFVLPRFNFGADLYSNEASGMVLGVDFLDPALSPGHIMERIDRVLFNDTMSAEARTAILGFLQAVPVNKRRIREAIGLAVASPEFQVY